MARRRSGFAKTIDTVHWTLLQEGFVALSAGTGARSALASQHLPETLLRIRGEWAANISGAAANAVGLTVSMGLILVPEGTAQTVLWSPVTDGDAPWIWWDTMALLYSEQVTDVVYSSQTSSGRRVVDSKAMRKSRNMELQLVVENVTISGMTGASVNVAITARVLAG